MDMYAAGEELFALRPLQYPEAARMKRDIALLEQLYTLYADAVHQLQQWCVTPWRRVRDSLTAAAADAAALELRWRKLPRRLREWTACEELRALVQNYIDVRLCTDLAFLVRCVKSMCVCL
jgi:dynein heavy chain, axonemal